jgi:hypothetical protein
LACASTKTCLVISKKIINIVFLIRIFLDVPFTQNKLQARSFPVPGTRTLPLDTKIWYASPKHIDSIMSIRHLVAKPHLSSFPGLALPPLRLYHFP